MKKILMTFAALTIASVAVMAQPPQGQMPPQGGMPGGMPPGMPGGFPGGQMQFRAPEPPEDPSFETKELSIPSGSNTVFALACVPKDGAAKKPVVIMSHGYGGNHMGFYNQMGELAKKGYITVAIDFCGGGRNSKSSGKSTEMSIFTEKQNLLDVIDYVRGWSNVDTDKVILLGESQGGCVSALTAAEVPEKVKAIALIYPAFCIPDDARAAYKTVADIPAEINFMGFNIGKAYYENLLDYDLYKDIPGFQKDVLIVHGDKDQVVNLDYSKKAQPLYKSCEFHVIEGGGHGFFGDQKTASDAFVEAFLAKETK